MQRSRQENILFFPIFHSHYLADGGTMMLARSFITDMERMYHHDCNFLLHVSKNLYHETKKCKIENA